MSTQEDPQAGHPPAESVPDHPARQGLPQRPRTLDELVASAQVAFDDQTAACDVGGLRPDAVDPSHLPGGVRNNAL